MSIYVVVNGEQQGPLTSEQVQVMVQSGKIKPSDPALSEGDSKWSTVAKFTSLSEEVQLPESGANPPKIPPVMGKNIEILQRESVRIAKITLNNETFRTEAGAMYYMRGNITMESKAPSVGGFLKAAVTGESVFRPTYSGTGELYLEPTRDELYCMNLNGGVDSTWILENGSYYASEMGVEVDVHREKALSAFKSGEGLVDFQTKISGTGNVLVKAPGPVEEIQLNNDKLVVDGTFAFARTATLRYSCERATKSILGSATSGEGMVRVYQGTGTVLMSPFAYAEFVRVLD